ncbi:Ribosome hibernation promoting factor [Phycisphaerae bacterium RAS2]|jgi:putative sigma-54 modulation protein|nr:Ribosome hibernation promoting factor [Phycisphaerae bacterium RAS2]
MQVTVSARHMEVSQKLREYAEEKAQKFPHFYDRVLSAEIVFDVEGIRHRCDIIVRGDHHTTFVAKEEHENPYAAFDAAEKDLERQLNRHKERHRNRKHPGMDGSPGGA